MSTFGRQSILTVGRSVRLSADGRPEVKHAGVTIDWSTVAAVSGAAVTLPDGVVVQVGEKYLRYGQLVTAIGVAEVQTVEFTGGPTAGSAVITLPAVGAEAAQSVTVGATASAASFQASLQALSRIGPNGATVARSGAGSAADPYVYTVTFSRQLGNVPEFTSTNTFTGGTTPSVTHGTTTSGSDAGGKYGPYDPGASDGRQTLSRGFCFLVNETVKENDLHSDHPPAVYGGLVWKDRLVATSGTHTLAAGPTYTELEAAFPRIAYVAESPA